MLSIFYLCISLTAYYLNENLGCKHRVMNCREIDGEHIGKNICNSFLDMPINWNITFDHAHVFFFRDNAGNIQNHKQKVLLLVQDVDTKWNLTYLMLERLKKLKLGVRYYVANYKNDQDSIITAKERHLIHHFFVIKECSKNNALLSSVMRQARSLTKFVNCNEKSETMKCL